MTDGPIDETSSHVGGDHPGDLLSAFVDDELDPAARDDVVAHLGRCPGCRDVTDAIRSAKRRLHTLPEVDGASAVGRFVARHRASIRAATVFVVVVSTAVSALGATAAVRRPSVVPAVDPMVALHQGTPESLGMEPSADVGDLFAAPPALLGNRASLSRRGVYERGGTAVVVYGEDQRAGDPAVVTVHQQHGRVDWNSLPAGDRLDLGGRRVWSRPGVPAVLVAQIGDLVVTVVADDRAAALTVVDGLPAVRRRSTYDRLHDACQRLTRVFALAE